MKIERPGSADRSSGTRKARRAGKGDRVAFARELAEAEKEIGGVSGPGGVAGATPVETVESLLALQEVDDATARNKRGRRQGTVILDHLEEIRIALLSGAISRQSLEQLERLVKEERLQVDDERLSEVLDEIELRAAVELAKWSRDHA